MDPKLSKNWRKAEPRLQDLPTANLGRISDPQVAIRPSSPAPEDAAVWLHPAAVLPAPQIANLWRAPEPEIATQRYLTYICPMSHVPWTLGGMSHVPFIFRGMYHVP